MNANSMSYFAEVDLDVSSDAASAGSGEGGADRFAKTATAQPMTEE